MSKLHLKKNPTLGDIQKYVAQIEKERGFAENTVTQKCVLLTEEIGELCKAIRKQHAGMRLDQAKNQDHDPAGEICDIIVVLSAIANRLDIDMEQAFRDKEEQNKLRTWG